MVYQEVWSNAAVGQQESEGWVGAEQKGEDSRADTLPTPAPGHLILPQSPPYPLFNHHWTNILTTSRWWVLPSRRKLLERVEQGFRDPSFLSFFLSWNVARRNATGLTATDQASVFPPKRNLQSYRIVLCVRRAAERDFSSPAPEAQNAGNAAVTSRKFCVDRSGARRPSRKKKKKKATNQR